MNNRRELVVVKFGTDCVTNEDRINDHTRRLAKLHRTHNLIVVASGAVARGNKRLTGLGKSIDKVDKRDRAFLGTAGSTGQWEAGFERRGILAGQVLMTHDEMVDAREGIRFRRAMTRILKQRFVPICNYKDFLSVASDPHDEITKIDEFRDNDRFGREIAEILGAKALILATNGVDGFEDQSGKVVHSFRVGRLETMDASDYQSSRGGTGGIVAKLAEAAVATESGMRSFVCNADTDFKQILEGQRICTEVVQ